MLQAFGLGLIPFSAQYLLLRGFYAFEDTRTPFRMALWISSINIALATACHLLLPPHWAVTGMAAAYALSYAIGLLLTASRLRRRTEGLLDGRRISRTYAKLTTAATAAGVPGGSSPAPATRAWHRPPGRRRFRWLRAASPWSFCSCSLRGSCGLGSCAACRDWDEPRATPRPTSRRSRDRGGQLSLSGRSHSFFSVCEFYPCRTLGVFAG